MRLGIITGSGTYALPGFHGERRQRRTPWGSCTLAVGELGGCEVVHLSRHGDGHARLSSHVTHRANIAGLREAGAEAVLAVTVCGAVDPTLVLGSLLVFDDLHFPSNRLPDGDLCSFHREAGVVGRGHWIFERPFSEELRGALLEGALAAGSPARDGGCYGYVDGPRFNSRAEIRSLGLAGVSAVSQTAGPEAVLCGEAGLPYALLGYVTDYANGVQEEPTPVVELERLIAASTATFSATVEAALARLRTLTLGVAPVGVNLTFP